MSIKTEQTDATQIAVLVEKVGTMSITLTKLDSKFDAQAEKYPSKERVEVLEKKVDNLESWKNKMLGALAIAQLIWGAILYFVTGHK